VSELTDFGLVVLVVSGAFLAALAAHKLTEFFPVPPPALFLVAAAVASDIWPGLSELSTVDVERIAVVALVVILFDGGMQVGWPSFRESVVPISVLGVVGTFATAGVMAIFAHTLFGFSWTTAGILGAAVAPTDPAVMFSVLGGREIAGRSGTILKGESGANDPVGIALMIGMLDFATSDHGTFWTVVKECAIEMSVGLAIGFAGAALLVPALRRISLPSEALYPLGALAGAGVIYGVAAVAHGSGFLAVFVAGLFVGGSGVPHERQIEQVQTSLASVAEVVVFVALGLTVDLGSLDGRLVWVDGILLAALLATANPCPAPARRAPLRRLGRSEGSGSDPARGFRRDRGRCRRAAHLRARFRDRAVLGDRAGDVAAVCGDEARRADARPGARVVARPVRRPCGRARSSRGTSVAPAVGRAAPSRHAPPLPRTAGTRPARCPRRRPASARRPRRAAWCARRGHRRSWFQGTTQARRHLPRGLQVPSGRFDQGSRRIELLPCQADVGMAPEALREDAGLLDGRGALEVLDHHERADRDPPGPARLRRIVLRLACDLGYPEDRLPDRRVEDHELARLE
jgi:NhaP-type Na+/H+ or K+/H+ antiporter